MKWTYKKKQVLTLLGLLIKIPVAQMKDSQTFKNMQGKLQYKLWESSIKYPKPAVGIILKGFNLVRKNNS